MKKTLLIILGILLTLTITTAQELNQEQIKEIEELTNKGCDEEAIKICMMLEELNIGEGVKVPFILPKNGIINAHFSDERIIGHIILENREIQQINCCEEHPEPTHNAKTNNIETILELKNSEDPLKEAQKKLSNKELTLTANSLTNKARLSVGKLLLRIASWF